MRRYAVLGNRLTANPLADVEKLSDELRVEFEVIERSTEKKLRRKFNEILKQTDRQFLRAQVGARSAHALFADAILYVLSTRPMRTPELHGKVKALLPDLCDDTKDLVINGQHFGKKWKHTVRTAQVFLRRKDAIQLIGDKWHVKIS